MDKETKDNEILNMRKHVNNCKRNMVHIMKKKIKKLKVQKPTRKDAALAETEKQLADVSQSKDILQKIHIDDISKLALHLGREQLVKMMNDESGDTKERLMARVAEKKGVQDAISKYREANPTWKQWIDASIKSWEATMATKKFKLQRKQNLKQKKANLLQTNGPATGKKDKIKKANAMNKPSIESEPKEVSEEKPTIKKAKEKAPSDGAAVPIKAEPQTNEKDGNTKKKNKKNKKNKTVPEVQTSTAISNNIQKKQKITDIKQEKSSPLNSPVKDKKKTKLMKSTSGNDLSEAKKKLPKTMKKKSSKKSMQKKIK